MSNIVPLSLLPEASEFSIMKDIARMSIASGLLPSSIKTPEAALIIMLKGREMGIPAMQAFSHIHVINGKPTMSAELMLTQIYKNIPSVIINYIQSDDKACVIECKRPNADKIKWSFTIEEAKRAELLNKGPWKQYPSAMLRARAISIMARAQFPDCLNGVSYTPEELGADILIDDNGNETIKEVSQNENPKTISFETTNNKKPTQETQVEKPIEQPKPIVNHAPKPQEPITYKNFTFKTPPEFQGKRFDQIEFAVLDDYMNGISFKYTNQPIPEKVQWFFDLYSEFINKGNLSK